MPADDEYLTTRAYTARCDQETRDRFPREFRDTLVSDAEVTAWTDRVLAAWWPGWPGSPRSPFERWDMRASAPVPPLVLLGPVGTGKTYQAFGAIRRIMSTGIPLEWEAVTEGDLFAALRPRDGRDSETESGRYARVPLLLLDDLGAAKASEWTDRTLDRLANHRWADWLPTIYTTNLPVWDDDPGELTLETGLSGRAYSRLAAGTFVTLKGQDRRKPTPPAPPLG